MGKMVFDIDDIHALRLQLADRRSRMLPEEAQRDFLERVARGRRAIEEARVVGLDAGGKLQQPDIQRL